MDVKTVNVSSDKSLIQDSNATILEFKLEPVDVDDEQLDLNDFEVEKWDVSDPEESRDEDITDEEANAPDSTSDEDFVAEEEEEEDDDDEEETKIMDFNGMKFECKGNYSQCPICHKDIKSTFIFRHIRLHQQPAGPYACPVKKCKLVVSRISNLFRHLQVVHHSKTPYICKHEGCSESFAKSQQLTKHLAQHRSAERKMTPEVLPVDKRFACEYPECGKVYGKRHHLREHERKHTGDTRYACEVCGKRFFLHSHMKRHLNSHTGIKPHICRWKCGAVFASYGGRMKHERINHYEENPLMTECDICGRPFSIQQQLQKHKRTHLNPEERKAFRCSFCGIMFDTIKMRERHEERHKEGETFECETCKRTFTNEKNLGHHIRNHHVEGSKESKDRKSSDDRNKIHVCHICGPPKLFGLTSLRRHIARIHSSNYKCDREGCERAFKSKYQLDAHIQQHKNRECHLCGRTFQRKQNADVHLMGVHELKKEDLEKLGRWHSRKNVDCPEYLVRSFKKKLKNRTDSSQHTIVTEIEVKEEPLDLEYSD